MVAPSEILFRYLAEAHKTGNMPVTAASQWRALAHEALHELEESEARYAAATRINAQTTYFPIRGSEEEGRVVFELPEGLEPGDQITIKNVGKDRVTIVPRPLPEPEIEYIHMRDGSTIAANGMIRRCPNRDLEIVDGNMVTIINGETWSHYTARIVEVEISEVLN